MQTEELMSALEQYADPLRAVHSQRFFKTGPGEYGEGDQFIGVTMPQLRKVCRDFRGLSLASLQELLDSPIHEHRMAAVVIMSDIFNKKAPTEQKALFDLYIRNIQTKRINNWDLIDVTAKNVVGAYLVDKPRDILYELARSDNLWARRVSIVSTPAFYVHGDAVDTLALAELLLHDSHDLMHKAVGWMLREIGKYVDEQLLTDFLDKHATEMPRTMLRYAIERLSEPKRKHYMT